MHWPLKSPWTRGALATLSLLTGLICAPALASQDWARQLQRSPTVDLKKQVTLYSTRNPGFPRIVDQELFLLPEDRGSAAGMAFLRTPVQPPFAVEFEYSIFDDDGGSAWNSGDGLALLFGRRRPARNVSLPTGGARGQVPDGSGYGVHLALYGERQLVLTDGNGQPLKSTSQPALYTHGRWSTVRVEVERNAIRVYLDGIQQLEWEGRVDDTHAGLALAAASGAADGRHAVRNLRIATRSPDEERPEPAKGPRELLLNGSFEEPRLSPGHWEGFSSLPGWHRSKGEVIEVQHGAAGRPAEGNQLVELDGNDSTSIYQVVTTRPGAEYELQLAFSARPGTSAGENVLEVLWNGQVLHRLSATGEGEGDTLWRQVKLRVRADSDRSRVELRDAGQPSTLGTYVDAVSLREVGRGGR